MTSTVPNCGQRLAFENSACRAALVFSIRLLVIADDADVQLLRQISTCAMQLVGAQ